MDFLKTDEQIALMREAGLLVWEAHSRAAEMVQAGMLTRDIDDVVEETIRAGGGIPLFKGVSGPVPFPAATCISVNEQVVHGIPGKRALREGDIVSLDIGVKLNGWCGDAAVTRPVGKIGALKRKLLDVTEGTLRLAIELAGQRERWSEVAREMERYVKRAGFSVVTDMSGHGIGQEMWEQLEVPNRSTRAFERQGDFFLAPGLVIAVEPMVNAGKKGIHVLRDHWTIATDDGKPSAHFEHTLAITRGGVVALTAGPNGEGWALA